MLDVVVRRPLGLVPSGMGVAFDGFPFMTLGAVLTEVGLPSAEPASPTPTKGSLRSLLTSLSC